MKAAAPILLILLAALAVRLAPLGDNRFLEDEALYGYWGLQIATGIDPKLDREPVDKPPLFPYAVALSYWVTGELERWDAAGRFSVAGLETAARLPSLLAGVASVALVYRLGRALYGDSTVGMVAALLVAASPFDISFASTAFTDPLMVALVLAALLAAASRHPGAAGLLAGLAAATKQQGLFFLLLVAAIGLLPGWRFRRRGWWRFALGFVAVAAAVIAWDLTRAQHPGFFQQSLIAYGGLAPAQPAALAERAAAWARQLSLFWGAPLTLLIGCLLLAWFASRWLRPFAGERGVPHRVDVLLVAFAALFLGAHWLVGFQVWDRYLLPLVPIVALLAARMVRSGLGLIRNRDWRHAATVMAAAAGVALLAAPARLATRGAWPAGGDHGAYDGIDQIAFYMRSQAPAGSVLYHYWLGTHYRFYLHGALLRLHWYPDVEDLVHDATVYRREPRYIAFPTFRDATAARAALEDAGMDLVPVLETHRRDGSLSFVLYRVEGWKAGRLEDWKNGWESSNLPTFQSSILPVHRLEFLRRAP